MREQSAYVAEEPELRNLKVLFSLMVFLIITDFVMPQYFGIHIGYDLTCTRLADLLIVLYMFLNRKILTHFGDMVIHHIFIIPFAIYLFVSIYTMVCRVDINAFFLVFLEILTFYILVYGIRYIVGWKRAIKLSIGCAYFLGIYGLIEFFCGQSIFLKFFSTVPNSVANSYRSGFYRIMGPCGHALGYGLLLLLFIALACMDIEKDEVYLFKRPFLIGLLYVNVFLTGSRSTLGIALIEMLLIVLISGAKNIKKSCIIIFFLLVALGGFLLLFGRTGIGRYVMMQITSVMDQFLGTSYSGIFGADTTTLDNSEEYRKYLSRIFQLDWLNPWIGRGVSRVFSAQIDGIYIKSIDNFYVSQYIKYGYPGMIAYILFIVVAIVFLIRAAWKYHSCVFKLVLIATVCYFFNLWWLDALQTLKFEYVLLAIACACYMWKEQMMKCDNEQLC